jgi:hypothetical protein
MKRYHNRFKVGSAAFTCEICQKLTRDTGHDEAVFRLCKKCLFRQYVDNAASDYGTDSPQYKQYLEEYEAMD